jgi:uncharacterized LabA/DUF88 family protein
MPILLCVDASRALTGSLVPPGCGPGDFLFGGRLNRTAFLVDGFNLYHSLEVASRELGGAGTKWLDLRSLCKSYLSEIGGGAEISAVIYFSALATFRDAQDAGVTERHRDYIECLRSTGVEVALGHFKQKTVICPRCGRDVTRHEEKETDVAIGVRLVDLFWRDHCDSAVLVTGDSDLAPAIRIAQRAFPSKRIHALFPFRRISFELKSLAAKSVKIKARRYLQHQFADPVVLGDGRAVRKPVSW